MRHWHHLKHADDQLLITMGSARYNSLSEERKKQVRPMVVTTPETCFGKTRLNNTRLWIELVVYKYFKDEIGEYEGDYGDLYNTNDIIDAMLVWFFETWQNSPYYNEIDYDERSMFVANTP